MKNLYVSNAQADALEKLAKQHNESIDNFINVKLLEHFGSEKINLSQWFEAQQLINEQNFYEKGHEILLVLRSFGLDCKQDMQSNKLHCPELGIYAY